MMARGWDQLTQMREEVNFHRTFIITAPGLSLAPARGTGLPLGRR